MILKNYNKLFNNLEKITQNDVKDKQSLQNIANLKKDLIKIKEFGKSSTKNNVSLLDGININYNVIEDELNNLRDIFLKDNLFDEMELELSHRKLEKIFHITHNLNSIKEVTNKKTLIFEILNLTLDKTKPVFSDLFVNELNKILNGKNITVINNELLKFENNLDKKTSLFLDEYRKTIDKNKIEINLIVLNPKYIENQLSKSIENLYDYLEQITNNLEYFFKSLHDLLQTYSDYSDVASDKINELIKTSLKKSILDSEIILKEIETILINTKGKIDLDTANALAEEKKIAEDNKKAEQLAKNEAEAEEEAKRLASEKSKKEAKEKALQELKEKERKSSNSLILGYVIILVGVILCCWGLWELSIFLWDNYSTEIKWITAILVVGFIILLYLAEYKLLSFILGVTCLSLWFYFGGDKKSLSNKPDYNPLIESKVQKKPIIQKKILEKVKSKTNTNKQITKTYDTGKYTGYFKDTLRHGQGTFYYKKSGDKYVGDWKYNNRNGNGTYYFSNSNKYVGEWKDNRKNGQGTYYFTNGDKYVGEWKDGRKNGNGIYTKNSVVRYVGEWKDGRKNGNGVYTYPNGQKTSGKFYKGYPSYGTELYSGVSGEKYIGNFKNWKRHGQGTYYYKNGNKYEGQWKNGKEHGSGILTSKNKIKKGIWENGKFMYATGSNNP